MLEKYEIGTQTIEAVEIAINDSDVIAGRNAKYHAYNQTQTASLILIYILSIAFIIFTPYPAKLMSLLFSDLGYGAMTPMFSELFCALLWAVEIFFLKKFISKRVDNDIFITKSEAKGPLPLPRLLILTAITVICVILISAQINWQVKLFYDVGSNTTGYGLMKSGGEIVKNAVKCLWMVFLISIGQSLFENFSTKTSVPAGGIILMLTLGALDLASGITLLKLTYVFLYAVFGWIFLITNKNVLKTYFYTWFIFVF